MAQKVKSMKEKLDGSFGNAIPLGANAVNIDLADGHNLQEALGTVKIEEKGNLQTQIDNVFQDNASTTIPKANGTAAVGVEQKFAKGDHVHPEQTEITGNAGTATKLQTSRNITLTGKVTGSVAFDGSADVEIDTTLDGNILTKDNEAEFTPTTNYNPATKKYVDDAIQAAIGTALNSSY